MARDRYSSESATTTTARLAGAMLCYMCDARERKPQQLEQTEPNEHAPLTSDRRPTRRPQPEKMIRLHLPASHAAVKPVLPQSSPDRVKHFRCNFQIKTVHCIFELKSTTNYTYQKELGTLGYFSVSLDCLFCDISEFVFCVYCFVKIVVPHILFDFYCIFMHMHIGTHIPISLTRFE